MLPPGEDRPRRGLRALAFALTAMMALPVTYLAGRPIPAGDTFWQLRTGADILAGRGIAGVDRFTYTVQGTPWNNHEWGFELALASVHHAFGFGGVRVALVALWLGVCAALVAHATRRGSAPVGFLCASLLVTLGSYKLIPAPQTASMALFLGAFAFARRDDLLTRPSRWLPLALYLCVWANVTAEVLTFLPFLLVDQLARTRAAHLKTPLSSEELRRRGLAFALVLLAALLTPPQSSVLEYALHGTSVNRAVNPEFTPLWLPAASVPDVVKTLGRALAVASLIATIASWLRAPTDPERVRRALTRGLCLAGAALIERNLFWILLPVASLTLEYAREARASLRAEILALGVGALSLTALLVGVHWTPGPAMEVLASPEWRSTHLIDEVLPVGCDPALAALPRGARVLTQRFWGGYVGWRAPQVLVFFDGRNREFPAVIHRAGGDMLAGAPNAGAILAASRTQWVLTFPSWAERPAVRAAGWHPIFIAERCALFAGPSSPPLVH